MNTSSTGAHVRSLHSQTASISEKLRSLDPSTKRLDHLIREKTALLRMLNFLQIPSGKLPPEMLSSIFKLTAPQPVAFSCVGGSYSRTMRTHFPLKLCAVSSHWRDVARSTPSLWASATLSAKGATRRKYNPFSLILYVENSKEPSASPRFLLPQTGEYPPQINKMIATVDLVLDWTRMGPHMMELYLNRWYFTNSLTPSPSSIWPQSPSTPLSNFYSGVPTFTEFYLHDPEAPHSALDDSLRASWFGKPVTFEHLEMISWQRSEHSWGSTFLECASTPVLRTLQLTDPDFDIGGSTEEANFFAPASHTLTTLELHEVQEIEAIHSSSPHTRIHSTIFMPNLRSLMVKGCTVEYMEDDVCVVDLLRELAPIHFEPLLSMLERRFVRGDFFQLVLSDITVDWTHTVQAGLRELVKKGIKLEVMEDGDIAD